MATWPIKKTVEIPSWASWSEKGSEEEAAGQTRSVCVPAGLVPPATGQGRGHEPNEWARRLSGAFLLPTGKLTTPYVRTGSSVCMKASSGFEVACKSGTRSCRRKSQRNRCACDSSETRPGIEELTLQGRTGGRAVRIRLYGSRSRPISRERIRDTPAPSELLGSSRA